MALVCPGGRGRSGFTWFDSVSDDSGRAKENGSPFSDSASSLRVGNLLVDKICGPRYDSIPLSVRADVLGRDCSQYIEWRGATRREVVSRWVGRTLSNADDRHRRAHLCGDALLQMAARDRREPFDRSV